MSVNTKESGLETIIVNYLRDVNGYVEGTSDMYSKDVAVVKPWLEAFLVAHNHPSGSPQPSKRDIELTWGLYGAGKMMGIPLLDHVIVTGKSHYSFADSGRLGEKNRNLFRFGVYKS